MTHSTTLQSHNLGLLTSFSIVKNRRDGERGHLFQGRFKAILVENKSYGAEVSRYIHLNPVRIRSFLKKPVAFRRKIIRNHEWNSYGGLIGQRSCPRWLARKLLLDSWGATVKEQQHNYSSFVEEGLVREIDDITQLTVAQTILGSEPFVDMIRRTYTRALDKLSDPRETPRERRVATWVSLQTMAAIVAVEYGVKPGVLLIKNSKNNESRKMFPYCAAIFCRGRYSLSEIAGHANVSLGGLSSGITKFKKEFERELIKRKMTQNVK